MIALLKPLAWFALSLFMTSSAQAFCRTRTGEDRGPNCPAPCTGPVCSDSCDRSGLPFVWKNTRIPYTFHVEGFPGLSEAQLRALVGASFATWANVRCELGPVGLEFVERAETSSLTLGPKRDEPNHNMIAFLSAEEWKKRDYDARALALTATWHDEDTGEVFGGDIVFNGGSGSFGECSDDGCARGDPDVDLQNVATHEIGHLLGLAHSPVPGSSLWCWSDRGEVAKRVLSADDIAGVCAAFPPGRHPSLPRRKDQAVVNRSNSCSSSTRADTGGTPAGLLALATALLVSRRVGRRSRRDGSLAPR